MPGLIPGASNFPPAAGPALPWALGGYEYGGSANQVFYGYVGDVRIVNRPLKVTEFMIAK